MEEVIKRNKSGEICTYIRNDQGIDVLKACISCAHKEAVNETKRMCTLFGSKVDRYHSCNCWEIPKSYAALGTDPTGKVIRPSFFKYLAEKRELNPSATYNDIKKSYEESRGHSYRFE